MKTGEPNLYATSSGLTKFDVMRRISLIHMHVRRYVHVTISFLVWWLLNKHVLRKGSCSPERSALIYIPVDQEILTLIIIRVKNFVVLNFRGFVRSVEFL